MQADDTFTFAQLTDVHLGPLPPFWPRHWNVKRILGFINFRAKRQVFHTPKRANLVVEHLKSQDVDHVAVTGDLTNLGMPAEFEQSHKWLQQIDGGHGVTVIPGNHDVYTRLLRDPGIERWRPYMAAREGDDTKAKVPPPIADDTMASGFPFVRTFGRFALICLNSGVYMPPAIPAGRLGDAQIARFVEISRALQSQGYVRIVLIHHPPLPEHGTHRGLRDAAAFEAALMEIGADLLIHGHNHRDMISWRDTATGPLPIVGAAAAGEGGYNIYRVRRSKDGACQIGVTIYGLDDAATSIVKIQHKDLDSSPTGRRQII